MVKEIQSLRQHLAKYNQEHLLRFWDKLEPSEQHEFLQEIDKLDIPALTNYYQRTLEVNSNEKLDSRMQPIPDENFGSVTQSTMEDIQRYREIGLRCIREEKVALLLLAGGQGTRLGVSYPKGMYDVGLPSHKSLFQIQVERLIRLRGLAKSEDSNSNATPTIPLYIMTSEGTKQPTTEYFKKNDYFGLHETDVKVFEQGMLPAFDFDGKIILEGPNKISKAPDGNGGLYKALIDQGILQDMKSRGIEYVHVYCVDNILVKVADPVFTGYCISKDADCGAKVVEKTNPEEQVGVFCKVDGKYQVVEYSEITPETAAKLDRKNRLLFNAGNICNHFFTTSFLDKLCSGLENSLVHHIAKKKIPYVDNKGELVHPTTPNGVKLEKFVFDVFRFSDNLAVWEVPRSEEFSPLKNSDSASKDTPTTCRQDLLRLHLQYLRNAGIKFSKSNETKIVTDQNNNDNDLSSIEISPLVSFEGEGLEFIANNFEIDLNESLNIEAKGEKFQTYSADCNTYFCNP